MDTDNSVLVRPATGRAAGDDGLDGQRLSSCRHGALMAALLLLVTLAAFWPVRHAQFITYDDPLYVAANPTVQQGLTWAGWRYAFSHRVHGNWQPLTWLSHMAVCQVFGVGPAGQHLANLLLHLANVLLLFLWLREVTARPGPSALVACLFAIHPLHVESVAWVAEHKDVLSTFFLFVTLCLYTRFVRRGGKMRYLLVLIAFALGLMSKAMVVTLPCLLLLLDVWPLERLPSVDVARLCNPRTDRSLRRALWASARRLVWEKVPLLLLTLTFSLITFRGQQAAGVMAGAQVLPFSWRLSNAAVSYVAYLGKVVWPLHLTVFYPHTAGRLPALLVASALLLLFLLSGLALWQFRRRPYLAIGWLWYIGMLVPVIGLVQVGLQSMADRYTYVPVVGIFIACTWGAADLLAGKRWRRGVLTLVLPPGLLILGVLCRRQVSTWRDGITLFRHALAVTEGNYVAHNNLGVHLYQAGQKEEAYQHFRAALRLSPFSYAEGHNNYGIALLAEGRFEEAAEQFRQAVRTQPTEANFHNCLGVALANLGRFDEADLELTEALRLNPHLDDAVKNLALLRAARAPAPDPAP